MMIFIYPVLRVFFSKTSKLQGSAGKGEFGDSGDSSELLDSAGKGEIKTWGH